MKIHYIDRQTKELKQELVYGEKTLRFLYGSFIGRFFAHIFSFACFSKLYGFWQNLPLTQKKVAPFVQKFRMDASEFEKPLDQYRSFNDFFTRKLKTSSRPLSSGELILPADARYLFYQNIEACNGFVVKGKKFSLEQLLQNASLAKTYEQGSMVIARLCPTDYHRFHFPCDCVPSEPRLINGPLYSVNPLAIRRSVSLLSENKRVITELQTEKHGKILFIEVGATNVGSIHQTYQPCTNYKKGEEKGYFSFGGSSIILLFEKNRIQIDQYLLTNSSQHIETLCLFGQRLES